VRSQLSVGLVMVCLGLAGCSLFERHPGKTTGHTKPFTGLPSGEGQPHGSTHPASTDPALPPGVDGFLAGQVVSKANNKRLPGAYIQVVDLQNPRGAEAALTAEADNQGFFTVRGLQRGRHYQLIARARDDNRILAGAALATPPNPATYQVATALPPAPKVRGSKA